jgi:hypothetical protein
MDSFYGTHIRACTTVGAELRVNCVDVAFRDSFYRTFIDTCAASCTIIINYICHSITFLWFEIIAGKNSKEIENRSAGDEFISLSDKFSGKRA